MTTGFLFDLTLEKPGAPKFSIGISSSSQPLHAVRPPDSPETWVSALCGGIAAIVPTWGEFSRSNDNIARRELCPECSWEVALEHGTAAIELAHRRPRDAYLEALGRAVPDPLLYQRVIERLLQLGDENEVEHHTAAGVLGHLTRHAPVVLSYDDCAEGVCEHEDTVGCHGRTAVCLACSILAGSWAGELEGMVSIPVAACGVLPAVAAHYEVTP
ncbi:hypothetical protein ACIRG5_19225 [Lentzea sp. NPDC102401]|uniref:hypothetical protein n=1 Tax=Lentzea sp. NPDC102401 TaxID=3364128 RepID=UPI00381034D2